MTSAEKARLLDALNMAWGIAASISFPIARKLYNLVAWVARRPTRG